jgi:hypothetical protein
VNAAAKKNALNSKGAAWMIDRTCSGDQASRRRLRNFGMFLSDRTSVDEFELRGQRENTLKQ